MAEPAHQFSPAGNAALPGAILRELAPSEAELSRLNELTAACSRFTNEEENVQVGDRFFAQLDKFADAIRSHGWTVFLDQRDEGAREAAQAIEAHVGGIDNGFKLVVEALRTDPVHHEKYLAERAAFVQLFSDLPLSYLGMRFGEQALAAQINRIRAAVDPDRKTIAIFAPTKAYRDHINTLGRKVRRHGYNVLNLFGEVCDDAFEREDDAYFAGVNIAEKLDFVDVIVLPQLMEQLPPDAMKIYVLHDIYISPPGKPAVENGIRLTFDHVIVPTIFHFDQKGAENTLGKRVDWAIENGKMDDLEYRRKCRWPKAIVPAGYIKLDKMIAYFKDHTTDEKTIIYAPTVDGDGFDEAASLTHHGYEIVSALLKNFPDYHIIFRPHPHTLESDAVARVRADFEENERFTLDADTSYLKTYGRSAVMVTDMSGTAFTYAFATLRPVIFFSPDEEAAHRIFKGIRYFTDRERVGYVAETIADMIQKTQTALDHLAEKSREVEAFRDEVIFNPGCTEDYLADNFPYLVEGRQHPDWVYVDEPEALQQYPWPQEADLPTES